MTGGALCATAPGSAPVSGGAQGATAPRGAPDAGGALSATASRGAPLTVGVYSGLLPLPSSPQSSDGAFFSLTRRLSWCVKWSRGAPCVLRGLRWCPSSSYQGGLVSASPDDTRAVTAMPLDRTALAPPAYTERPRGPRTDHCTTTTLRWCYIP